MNSPPAPNPYKRHRFPAEIISHGVWLYFRFCLSYRDVEELMAERGVILTYDGFCQFSRHKDQRRLASREDSGYAAAIILINWANRS